MSESEQREIEEAAELVDFSNHAPDAHEVEFMRIGYIAGATRMAEKKNLEVKVWKNTADEFKKYNDELKQQAVFADEIQNQLQTRIEQDIAQLEAAQEEIEKAMFDIQVGNDLIKSLQAELSRVKEVVEKMTGVLTNQPKKK